MSPQTLNHLQELEILLAFLLFLVAIIALSLIYDSLAIHNVVKALSRGAFEEWEEEQQAQGEFTTRRAAWEPMSTLEERWMENPVFYEKNEYENGGERQEEGQAMLGQQKRSRGYGLVEKSRH